MERVPLRDDHTSHQAADGERLLDIVSEKCQVVLNATSHCRHSRSYRGCSSGRGCGGSPASSGPFMPSMTISLGAIEGAI